MILDIAYFGSGIGLVMIGWVSGLAVSYVFNLMGIIPRLSSGGKR